jgi:predicted  nucleic acid-binding Zn-ribbon protein
MADVNIIIQAKAQQAISEMKRAETGVRNLGGTIKKNTGVSNQYGKVLDKNTRGLSTFAKSGLQQTGYQLGDFAVQVGGGTSALQAFGQQGSQLLQIFGPIGSLLGAAVAIVAAVGVAYQKSSSNVSNFSKQTENLNKALSQQSVYTKNLTNDIEALKEKYGSINPELIEFLKVQRQIEELRVKQEIRSVSASIRQLAKDFSAAEELTNKTNNALAGVNGAFRAIIDTFKYNVIDTFSSDLDDVATKFGINKLRVKDLRQEFEAFTKQGASTEEKLSSINNILSIFSERGSKATEDQDDLREMLIKVREAIVLVSGGVNSLDEALEKVAQKKDFVRVAAERVAMATSGLGEVFSLTLKDGDKLAQGLANSMGSSFSSIVKGTLTVKDAFRSMALSIIDQLLQVLVIQRIVGTVGGISSGGVSIAGTGLAGILSGTTSPVYGPSKPPGLAIGGSMQRGKPYLVGERGPELFMANSSGSIVPNNKMGGGAGVVVNQTINVSTGVAQTVRTEIATLMPQIAEASKAAVLDAKQRGGNFSRAF